MQHDWESAWASESPHIRRLLEQGSRTDAWHRLEPYWQQGFAHSEPTFLQLGHDACWWLGFDPMRFWLERRAFRQHSSCLWAWSRRLLDDVRKGRVLHAWERLQRTDRPKAQNQAEEVQFAVAQARVLTTVRDFTAASECVARAVASHGDSPKLARERGWITWFDDKIDEAKEHNRNAREAWPEETLLREQECWFLLQSNQTQDALAALDETAKIAECPSVDLMYADALFEQQDYEGAAKLLEQALVTRPLKGNQRTGAHMLLARAQRCLGNDAGAVASMQQAGPRMKKWADRLASFTATNAPGTGRVVRQVPYVRQDHVTCSPATMASLLSYAGLEVDQREIAAQITYDGTPSHAELRWARERGLSAWFFEFDLEVAHQLIDRDLPFALSTRGEQMGHRQAVCGYDLALNTLLLRDPNSSTIQEVDAESLLESMQSRGGDCALILPKTEAHRVTADLLPHTTAQMQLQELRQAYDERQLSRADDVITKLLAGPPSHARWDGAVRVAYEREDRATRLQLYRERYEGNPNDGYWHYYYALELRAQDRWQLMVETLERHIGGKSPFLSLTLAEHLRHAASTAARAEQLARHACRRLPANGLPIKVLADIQWQNADRRDEARELYRLAARLDPHNETHASSYFTACVQLGEPELGLQFLHDRVQQLGGNHAEPRTSYAQALDSLNRKSDAITELQRAMANEDTPKVRSDLFDMLLDDSQHQVAAQLLKEPERWQPLAFQDARHRLALAQGDHQTAAAALQAAVELEPSNGNSWIVLLRNVLAHQGRNQALEQAHQCVREQGDNPHLLVRIQEFFDEVQERGAGEQLLRRLVTENPQELWLQGRWARFLIANGRATEAKPLNESLLEQLPDSVAVHIDAIDISASLREGERTLILCNEVGKRWASDASVLTRRRRLADSKDTSVRAVREAMTMMLASHLPPTDNQIEHIVRAMSQDLDDQQEVAAFLQQLQERFSDNPDIPAAHCRWLSDHDATGAVAIAERLQSQFPWLLQNWILLGKCLRSAGRRDDERTLLERLLKREPSHAAAWAELGESLEQEGRTQEAIATYNRGIEQAPTSPTLHGMRASLLWSFGEREAALMAANQAAALAPDYGWVRRAQVMWHNACGQHSEALTAAQECVRDNPSWALSYELLAAANDALGHHEERITALRNALQREPRLGSARQQLLAALLELRRFEQAEQVIQEGLELLEEDPELLLTRLRIARMQGDLSGSRAGLRSLLAKQPDFDDGWGELLMWLEEEGLGSEILALGKAPPEALKDSPTMHAYVADVHLDASDLVSGQRSLQAALKVAPDHDWARDRLAQVFIDRRQYKDLLALFPGATDPDQLPLARAAMLCNAYAQTGEVLRAERFFKRLLREPEAEIAVLRNSDNALTQRNPERQDILLSELLRDSEQHGDFVRTENCLQVYIGRRYESIWLKLSRFAESVPEQLFESSIARLIYACNGIYPVAEIAQWVDKHLDPPIEDTDAWARFVYALNEPSGAKTAVRITAGNYRRLGVRGWMLANLSGVHADLKHWSKVREVSMYALESAPADHSVWWHRRLLAEAAYEDGDYETCLSYCTMETEQHPTEKVRVVQLEALARMQAARSRRDKRQIFAAALPEILRQEHKSDAENDGTLRTSQMLWSKFFRAAPGLRTMLMALGKQGRWLAKKLLPGCKAKRS
ncbi:MAG: tetratricopeptide (TPR) repeat protein [Planctomycetota bacterium]|jgi:tetratricopeptide (TPR) repeat protein